MSDKKLVETIYGKRNKFEVYRNVNLIANDDFVVYKDGKYFSSHKNLNDAIARAKKEGGVS